jgi:hypothetical protein
MSSKNKMDTANLKVSREKLEAVAVHQEVPDEETEVETIGALDDRYGERRLAFRRCGMPNKYT